MKVNTQEDVVNVCESLLMGIIIGLSVNIGFNIGGSFLIQYPDVKNFDFFVLFIFAFVFSAFLVLGGAGHLLEKTKKKKVLNFFAITVSFCFLLIPASLFFIGMFVWIRNQYMYFAALSLLLFIVHFITSKNENNILLMAIFFLGTCFSLIILLSPNCYCCILILTTGYLLGMSGYLFKKTPMLPIF